jgi:hypothetical protein
MNVISCALARLFKYMMTMIFICMNSYCSLIKCQIDHMFISSRFCNVLYSSMFFFFLDQYIFFYIVSNSHSR